MADFDVAIVGGGVIGLAIAKIASSFGYSCVVFEKNADCLSGASGGNSGVVCTGFDAPHDSLEFKLIRSGVPMLLDHVKAHNLPSRPCGSLVVATTPEQIEKLRDIVAENHAIGDTDVKVLSRDEVFALEPHLSSSVLAAAFIPGEVIVDPWLIPASYKHEAEGFGAKILTHCAVQRLVWCSDRQIWRIDTSSDRFTASTIVNAAGNYGDEIERLRCEGTRQPLWSSFRNQPRHGQYLVLDPSRIPGHQKGECVVTRPIQPIPTDTTKGVFLFTSLYGHVIVGPTADDSHVREGSLPDPVVSAKLYEYAVKMVPVLKEAAVVGSWVGIRPATDHRDYQIRSIEAEHWVTVSGIRSTGLTASLGIGHYVVNEHLVKLVGPRRHPERCITPFSLCVDRHHLTATTSASKTPASITHPIAKLAFVSKL